MPTHALTCSVCGITVMGNSLVEGCTGHSLAEAAVAGTALLVGPHAGKWCRQGVKH